ncbi:MAG TPA: type VI secretion system tip protein TssI/VgrG [Gemmataceae bacterium]|nr:type VI secretion system tip protein TssI/VgrG [Gemmataceae bacterium]
MAVYKQSQRLLRIATPVGPDALLLESFNGTEALSELFHLQLNLLAASSAEVPFEKLLGQPVTISVAMPGGATRYFNGIVSRFSQGPQLRGPLGDVTFVRYRAEVVPALWMLARNFQSRIFQQMTVPDILKKVLAGLNVSWQIQGTFTPRDYCVQYRESDFAFASRLMEEEGIWYAFQHSEQGHTLVIANTPQSHPDVPGPTSLIYETVEGGYREEDRILAWEKTQEIRAGKETLWDHCFELPGKNLEAVKTIVESVQAGTIGHKLKGGGNDRLEIYEYPGGYAQRFDGVAPGGGDRSSDLQKIFDDNKRTAAIRIEQEALPSLLIRGESSCRHLTAGCKFTLSRHFNANGPYVLTRVSHHASVEGSYTNPSALPLVYHNRFECIPAALPFRPLRVTPKARVEGAQTAVVVGPAKEEIFTDKYGRIKVQFPWDRQGKNDADSSCWVRVATPWAGQQWGAIQIPRVGQEVVIDFLEGDPDRPLAVGSVYNAGQMPPYKLPDNKTQSGIKSRSTLQGDGSNANELRFEDKKDSEYILLHAEKDFQREVENNDTLKVGYDKKDKGDQTIEVFNNQSLTVGGGQAQAADGSQTITVFNNQKVTVGDPQAAGGSQTITVYKDRSTTLQTGNDMLAIKVGNQTIKLDLGASSTEAMQSIELKVGQNSIKIDQTGVTIQGLLIKIQGQIEVQVQGTMTQINGDAMIKMQGGIVMIN